LEIRSTKSLPSPTYLRPPKRGLRAGGSGFAQASEIRNEHEFSKSKWPKQIEKVLDLENLNFGLARPVE
jgi:hypothetical protein